MIAICRVAKCKGVVSISGRTEHNYRKGETPNADPERTGLNREYVNSLDNLSKAVDKRLKEAGITKTRKDAVKAMEFILSASPEAFPRDDGGQVTGDYRQSTWLNKNLTFMQDRYGANLVAFTLHQDELTPHIHAIVVPVTADNRLCAKELFNPRSLRQLQTDYAKAVGLERGLAGSKAKHVAIRQIYAAQQKLRQSITEQITVDRPAHIETSPARWQAEQQAKVNAQIEPWLIAAKQYAKENDELKKSQQQMEQKIQKLQKELAEATKRVDRYLVLANENRFNKAWLKEASDKVRSKYEKPLEVLIVKNLKGIKSGQVFIERMKAEGFELISTPGKQAHLKSPKFPTLIHLDEALMGRINKAVQQTMDLSNKPTPKQTKAATKAPKVG